MLTETQVPGFSVRGAVVVGEERAVVWDTLSRPADMEAVRPLLADREVVVVYSHADWDHAWGTAGLGSVAEVVAHRTAAERLAREAPGELEAKRREDQGRYADVRIVLPTLTFDRSHDLQLGGLTLELRALPGHTADCIVGLVPQLGVLLAGDTVETPLPLLNRGSGVSGWVRDLEAWARDARVQRVVPAHGELGGPELLGRTAGYLRGLLAGVSEPPGEALDDFYRKAHARNLAHLREGGIS